MQFREFLARDKEYAEPETTYVEAPTYEGDGENTVDSHSIWYGVISVCEVVAFYDSTGQECYGYQVGGFQIERRSRCTATAFIQTSGIYLRHLPLSGLQAMQR